MGIINDILSVVDQAVEGVAQSGFSTIAGNVGNVITAGSIVLVALLGVNIVAQIRPMTFGSFFAFGMKIVLVGIFAQSWANFEIIYDIITKVPDSIGATIIGGTEISTTGGLYNALDGMVSQVTKYGDAIGDNAGWVFGAVLGVAVWVIAGIFAAIAAGIIAYAKIVLTIFVVLGPLAIVCSLFKATMPIFEAWTRSIIGYAFMPIAAAGAAGLVIAIAGKVAEGSPNPDNVETLSVIFPFIVVLLLSAGIMTQVPAIAQGLSGTIGLAANAVGLSGLAKRGTVKIGSHIGNRVKVGTTAGIEALKNPESGGSTTSQSVPARSNPNKILAATNKLRKK